MPFWGWDVHVLCTIKEHFLNHILPCILLLQVSLFVNDISKKTLYYETFLKLFILHYNYINFQHISFIFQLQFFLDVPPNTCLSCARFKLTTVLSNLLCLDLFSPILWFACSKSSHNNKHKSSCNTQLGGGIRWWTKYKIIQNKE